MKLAEGRPLRRRMMAAMAQQDCGQCGYNCNDYSEAIASKAEPRLNLCVPGGKETARMLKALHEELEKAPAGSIGLAGCARGRDADRRRGARPFARQSGAGDVRVASPAQQDGIGKGNLAYRFRSRGCGLDYVVGDSFGIFARNESRPGRSDHRPARRVAYHRSQRQDAARCPDRRRLAGARAGHAVRTALLHYRWRAAREGARAGARRGSRRRCRHARRDGGAAKILRRTSASRSLCRGAGAAAAAALFDLLVAQRDARQTVADGRLRALRGRQAQAAWAGLDIPGRTHQSRRSSSRSMCRRPTASRCRRIRRRRSS